MRQRRRHLVVGVLVACLSVAGAAPAGAHGKTVDPPGRGEGHEPMPVSRPWAQAHCMAASPAVIADRGAAAFQPAEALTCADEADAHPAGRTHPHAPRDAG